MEKVIIESWVNITLGDILKLKNGYAFKSSDFAAKGLPVVRISNIQDGKVMLDNCIRVNETLLKRDFIVENGDILIAMSGATSGKYGIYKSNDIALQNQRVGNLKPIAPSLVGTDFIFHLLANLRKEVEEKAYGGAQPNISPSLIEGIRCKLPPVGEQQRIVRKLNAIFKRLEKISSKIQNIKALKSKFTDISLFDGHAKGYYLKVPLVNYLEECNKRIGNEWPLVPKVGVSAKKGIIELATGMKETFENYKIVQPGDFVYNAMRINIGSIAIYEGDCNAITSPDYFVFRVTNGLSKYLLLSYLKSEAGLMEINANTKGSVRSRLYFSNLINVRMPVSPSNIQQQAEKGLSWFNKAITVLEENTLPKVKHLRESILLKAFSGSLVAQDPNDEPGSDLLKRIRQIQTSGQKVESNYEQT